MTARVSHLPVLVGVVEVLLGVLDLTHVHQHFSINFPAEKSPQIFSGIPKPTTESGSNQKKATIHRGEYEKSKDSGVGRRRAYLGADAVFAEERRHESQRGERVGGLELEETVWSGALGMDGGCIFKLKGNGGTRPSVRRWTGEMARGR